MWLWKRRSGLSHWERLNPPSMWRFSGNHLSVRDLPRTLSILSCPWLMSKWSSTLVGKESHSPFQSQRRVPHFKEKLGKCCIRSHMVRLSPTRNRLISWVSLERLELWAWRTAGTLYAFFYHVTELWARTGILEVMPLDSTSRKVCSTSRLGCPSAPCKFRVRIC